MAQRRAFRFKDPLWFKPIGSFSIVKIHVPTGKREIAFGDHNLVVDNAKEILARLLSGLPEYRITHIAVGTGGDPLNPLPPLPTDTTIEDLQFKMPVELITYPSFNSVQFRAIMDENTGNDLIFTTAGLWADLAPDGKQLFAKRNHGGVAKTPDFMLEYNWIIVF